MGLLPLPLDLYFPTPLKFVAIIGICPLMSEILKTNLIQIAIHKKHLHNPHPYVRPQLGPCNLCYKSWEHHFMYVDRVLPRIE